MWPQAVQSHVLVGSRDPAPCRRACVLPCCPCESGSADSESIGYNASLLRISFCAHVAQLRPQGALLLASLAGPQYFR